MSDSSPPVDPNSETFIPQSTVLIVDDNPQNVELLAAFLEPLPIRILTASDGIDAMRSVAANKPNLILLDVMMPHMSGFQVCECLKRNPGTCDIPIMMLTALNDPGDIQRAYECGADDFASKPINKSELRTHVGSLLKVQP